MNILLSKFRKIVITILFVLTTAIVMPTMAYKDSAQKAESLIEILQKENDSIVSRTTSIVHTKLDLNLSRQTTNRIITDLMMSSHKEELESKITRYIRMYRITLSSEDYTTFVNYIDEKRLYYLENHDSIRRYLHDYNISLNSVISGAFIKIAGFPKSEFIIKEIKMASFNDVTGDNLISKTSNENYRNGWDAIFGKNKEKSKEESDANNKENKKED